MPSGSAATLLNGELPLRYCSSHFACRVPTWGLPAHGHAQGLLAELAGAGEVPRGGQVQRARLPGLVGGARVSGSGRALGGRLLRNPPAHLAGYGTEGSSQSRPRVWKRLRVEGSRFRHNVAQVPRLQQGDEAHGPLDRVGVGKAIWGRASPRLQALHE